MTHPARLWFPVLLLTLVARATGSLPLVSPALTAASAPQANATDTVRFVRDHALVSRAMPRMTMAVDPRLESIGALEFDLKQVAHVQRFVFGSRDDQGAPARLMIVQFESMLPGVKGAYRFGLENATRLGAHEYQTQTGFFNFDEAAAARPGAEAEHTQAFFAGKGWNVAGQDFIVARYARIVDEQKRSEIIVFYYENVRALGRTRHELEQDHDLEGIFRDVRARTRLSFTIRDDG